MPEASRTGCRASACIDCSAADYLNRVVNFRRLGGGGPLDLSTPGHGSRVDPLIACLAMSTTTASPTSTDTTDGSVRLARRGRWIEHWDPENRSFWAAGGCRTARRNLILSILAEHLGFSIWVLWTVVVINLGNVGIKLSLGDQFLLTAVPNLIGSFLRVPYTFAIPRFGGRAWTTFSVALLLVPTTLVAVIVPSGWLAEQGHSTQLCVLLLCAASAGVGGGNFSSSMANISFFYPERDKGFALSLNAAGGNLGVAMCQLIVPLVIVIGVPNSMSLRSS